MLDMVTLLLLSIAVGLIGSLIGLGGASILTPILVLLGFPVKEAVACGMVAIIATSSGSASSFVKDRITNIKVAMYLEMFTIIGAIVGATITVIVAPVFLYFLFAGFLLTSFINFRSSFKEVYTPPEKQDKISKRLGLEGSYFDKAKNQVIKYKATNSLLGGLGMFVAGIAAGMLGIGAGAFKVIVHEKVLKIPSKVSSASSSFIGMTALAGVSVYLFSGLLNLTLMAPMAVGTTIGAVVGGRLLNRIRDRNLRILFLVIVTLLIIQMLYKGVTTL